MKNKNHRWRQWMLIGAISPILWSTAPPGRYTDENGFSLTPSSTQVKDTVTGLIWQRGHSNSTYTLSVAQTYCSDLTIGAQSNWRTPTLRELASLLDLTRIIPSIDENAFPNTASTDFWTSTISTGASNSAWRVGFFVGYVGYVDTSGSYYVRCVRP